MSSATMFIAAILFLALVFTVGVFRFDFKSMKEYFSTKQGKGVVVGIIMFTLFGIGLVLASKAFSSELEYFQWGDVYLGLDNTNHISPMCEDGTISSRLTSNGGVRVNLIESSDERFSTNTYYLHKSCAFNSDDQSYDAIGLEVVYRLWSR